ncbi:MAG: hypothetical protein ACRDRV_05640 [Pseudonocardiaceae bacterium]
MTSKRRNTPPEPDHARPPAMTTQTYSESHSDRSVLAFRGIDGATATVIVMRTRGQVWLTFNGAEKTTVAMTDPQAGQLIEALRSAARGLS